MAEVKLTKNELRTQQVRFKQLEKFLPTLQLKKAMLQTEVNEVRIEILRLEDDFHDARLTATHSGGLLNERVGLDLTFAAKVAHVDKEYENIAGVDIPIFKGVQFEPFDYPLFSTPSWLDAAVADLRRMAVARVMVLF
jgi:V/A-type H+-transporting ATPase subunit D